MYQDLYNQSKQMMGGYDYLAPYQTFMQNIAPQFKDLVYGGGDSMMGYAQQQANQTQRQLSQQYSGSGSLFSGAFGEALGAGVSQPYQQAAAGLNQQLGSLYGNALSTMPQAYAQPYQWANQNMQTAAQGMGQMGQPTYWQPDYAYQPGAWDYLSSAVSMGADVARMVTGFGGGGGGAQAPIRTGGLSPAGSYYMNTPTPPGLSSQSYFSGSYPGMPTF